ncbi:MAG: hypothetical protein AAB694_02185 [Patescibacteria group bacterium]
MYRSPERKSGPFNSSLQTACDNLYWIPQIDTPGEYEGIVVETTSLPPSTTFIDESGEFYILEENRVRELDIPDGHPLIGKTLELLRVLKQDQLQEIMEHPEGRDVRWWPGQFFRLPHWSSSYYRSAASVTSWKYDYPITVRAKADGLYCPDHPQRRLFLAWAPTEDREKFWECPERDCNFSVYSGT